MGLLKFIGDVTLVAIGRKIPQRIIDELRSSGRVEIGYRRRMLEEFGSGFLLRNSDSHSHSCFDGNGYYSGTVCNSF